MSDLIKLLECFNRKERHFLALELSGKEGFTLSDCLRKKLECEIGVGIPDCAFVAIDYHLDWVDAALHKAYCTPNSNGVFAHRITGTQRDSDCFIAFESEGWHHLVFLEAKGPDGKWDKDQLEKKANHLKKIFGKDRCKWNEVKVKPHFCMTSSEPPKPSLKTDKWPDWMTKENTSYYWFKWCLPNNRLKPTRCDAWKNDAKVGDHFRIDCMN